MPFDTSIITSPRVVALLLFVISLSIRTYRLGDVSSLINPDGLDTLWTYLVVSHDDASFFTRLNWNGASGVNAWILGMSWELFGQSVFGLRFPPAFIGALAVTMLFFVVLQITNRKAIAFAVALAYCCNPWNLNFGREAWENIFNAFVLCGLVAGVHGYVVRGYHLKFLILAVGSAAAATYCYHPGKLFIIGLLSVMGLHLVLHRRLVMLSHIAFALGLFLVLSSFALFAFWQNYGIATDRIRTVSVMSQDNPSGEIQRNIVNTCKGLLLFEPLTFNNERYLPTDRSPVHRALLPLYLIGLCVSLSWAPELLIIFLVVLLPTQLLSTGCPDGARAIHALPLIFLFTSLGALTLANVLMTTMNLRRGAFEILLVAGVTIISIQDVAFFFDWTRSQRAIQVRHPGVKTSEFSLWVDAITQSVSDNKGGFNVGYWEDVLRPTIVGKQKTSADDSLEKKSANTK